jgi:hypothetical protein
MSEILRIAQWALCLTIGLPFAAPGIAEQLAPEHSEQRTIDGAVPAPEITPLRKIQSQLDQAVAVFLRVQNHDGTDDAFRQLDELRKSVDKNMVVLVEQWAYYIATATDERKSTIPLMFLNLMEISNSTRIAALAPHLDSDNPRLLDLVRDQFDAIDQVEESIREPLNPPRFGDYSRYIKAQQQRNQPIPCNGPRKLDSRLS